MITLKRSRDGIIGGVCKGIADSTDTSALAWRLIFLFMPSGLGIYLILWVLLKERENEF